MTFRAIPAPLPGGALTSTLLVASDAVLSEVGGTHSRSENHEEAALGHLEHARQPNMNSSANTEPSRTLIQV